MEISFFKLGENVTDTASGTKGMLTHVIVEPGMLKHYLFQPCGLSPKTKQPLETLWIDESRIFGGKWVTEDLPIEVLGTQVEDKASGFKGTATSMEYHLNGCIHFAVKPKGIIEETGDTIKTNNFDLRRLKGSAIKEMSEEEVKASEKEKPSPIDRSTFIPGKE